MKQLTHNPILVLGAGSWGCALTLLLHANGCPVRLWTHDHKQAQRLNASHEDSVYLPGIRLPKGLFISSDLEQSLQGITDVLIAVPSFAFLEVLLLLKSLRPTGLRIAWGTKGLEPNRRQMLHSVVMNHYGEGTPLAVISGPSFAKEVALGLPTAVSLAGNDQGFNQSLIERLHNKHFRVYCNSDLIGVELCGVVKNVLAIAVGISDGLGFGANARSALITRGLVEMGRLCVAAGGKQQTVLSLSGVGDLILTCTDDQSRNRRFGLILAQQRNIQGALAEIGHAVEGYYNAQHLKQYADDYAVVLPIIECMYQILYAHANPQEQVAVLMERDPGME